MYFFFITQISKYSDRLPILFVFVISYNPICFPWKSIKNNPNWWLNYLNVTSNFVALSWSAYTAANSVTVWIYCVSSVFLHPCYAYVNSVNSTKLINYLRAYIYGVLCRRVVVQNLFNTQRFSIYCYADVIVAYDRVTNIKLTIHIILILIRF